MIITKILKEEEENLQKKYEAFDKILESRQKPALGYIKWDPTLFAYYYFTDDRGQKFKALSWQDKFLNSKSKRRLMAIARQCGKTTTVSILALHIAFFNPNILILVVSRTKEQAKEVVYRMRRFLNTSRFTIWKELAPSKKESKSEIIIRNQGAKTDSRIIVVPATDAALGYTANVLIGDEASRWEDGDYIFKDVLEPTTTFTNGDIFLLSTPNGKRGFFWECYNLQDIWEVYQFDWHINPYLTEEYMAEKRKLHTAMSWAINYEAKFVASEDAYFNPRDIKACTKELDLGYPTSEPVCVGVDFGKINDKCIIIIGKILNPNDKYNEQIIKVIDRRVKPLGTNYASIIGELKAINTQYNVRKFVLDATGVGEAPSDILMVESLPIESIKFSWQKKADIFSNLKIFFEQKRIEIPNERELIDQLEIFEYEYTLSGVIKLHAPEGAHDDECDALALMVWGLSGVRFPPPFIHFVSDVKEKPKGKNLVVCCNCDNYFKSDSDSIYQLCENCSEE